MSFTALPAQGWGGVPPEFPLPPRVVTVEVRDGSDRWREVDKAATARVAEREAALWAWAWHTPQAAAWAQPSGAWLLYSVAMWVRTYVVCESSEATAADKGSLHRFADQIGLTPSGLRDNGWAVARDEVAEQAVKPRREARPRRLSAVPEG